MIDEGRIDVKTMDLVAKWGIELMREWIPALEYVKENTDIRISTIQKAGDMGYARAAECLVFLIETGILSERSNPPKYHMAAGEDGKRRRRYEPFQLAISKEAVQTCIDGLKSYMEQFE